MIMKTKHVKNTGTNGQEGANWKITRWGQTGKIARRGKQGKLLGTAKGPNIAQGGIAP